MEAKSPESDTTTVLVALSWSRELGILMRVVVMNEVCVLLMLILLLVVEKELAR